MIAEIKQEQIKELYAEQYSQEFEDWKKANKQDLLEEFAEERLDEFEEFAWEQYKVLTS